MAKDKAEKKDRKKSRKSENGMVADDADVSKAEDIEMEDAASPVSNTSNDSQANFNLGV